MNVINCKDNYSKMLAACAAAIFMSMCFLGFTFGSLSLHLDKTLIGHIVNSSFVGAVASLIFFFFTIKRKIGTWLFSSFSFLTSLFFSIELQTYGGLLSDKGATDISNTLFVLFVGTVSVLLTLKNLKSKASNLKITVLVFSVNFSLIVLMKLFGVQLDNVKAEFIIATIYSCYLVYNINRSDNLFSKVKRFHQFINCTYIVGLLDIIWSFN